MREITSKNNQIYRLFQKLTVKKYRDRFGLYLIEGENLIEEALKNKIDVEHILVRSGEEQIIQPYMNLDKVFITDKKLFADIAQTKTSQGIVASVRKPELSLEDFLKRKSSGNFVVLDRLQDPGNIGTIIRTADAAGYSLVIAMKGTGDVFSPKVARAAAGSLFRMPIVTADSPKELARLVKDTGKKLAASCLDGNTFYYEEDLKSNIALIVGNEGNGICDELISAADLKIKIPMCGNIESLNASVAAAIIMYEAVRKDKD